MGDEVDAQPAPGVVGMGGDHPEIPMWFVLRVGAVDATDSFEHHVDAFATRLAEELHQRRVFVVVQLGRARWRPDGRRRAVVRELD